MKLSRQDAFAIGRALMGKEPVEGLVLTPLAEMLVNQLHGSSQDKIEQLKQFFGQEVLQQIFEIDPDGEPPVEGVERLGAYVPELPEIAKLAPPDKNSKVGVWLDEYMAWITSRASTTPHNFALAGGLWAIGLVTARRASLRLSIGRFYNNLYVLWSAPTTVFAKSTGLRHVEDLVRAAVPHLLLASNNTPELLLYKLSGGLPSNKEDLSPQQMEREMMGKRFAGQRGALVDEAASLFAGKKYMEGLVDLFMQLYDCPSIVEHEFKTQGKLIVERPSLSLMLGTTPARLQEIFGDGEWMNGLLPRFALLTPDRRPVPPPFVNRVDDHEPVPGHLVVGLAKLNERLPQPAKLDMDNARGGGVIGEQFMHIDDDALTAYNRYKDGIWHLILRQDQRLSGVYGRLHTQALKIAMSLRLIDWANMGGELVITLPYWQRAQHIAEQWRESAHRLLAELNYSSEMRDEDAIKRYLKATRTAKTARQIQRGTAIHREADVKRAVNALAADGEILVVRLPNGANAYATS